MPRRQKIKIQGKYYYAKRDKLGKFTDISRIDRSIKADARKKAKKKVKRGYGHMGDLR